jgi:hypothetical protein
MEKGTEILLKVMFKAVIESDHRAGVRSPFIQEMYQMLEEITLGGDPVTASEIGKMADFARDVSNQLQYSN